MASFFFASLSLLVQTGSTQVVNERIWSAAAFVYHGELTPLRFSSTRSLTPLGAQQMFDEGTTFRQRYLDNSNFDPNGTVVSLPAPIEGVEINAIDNSQLYISSSNDGYSTASALAFLQGLYPPLSQAFSDSSGGMAAARLANGSIVDYPLDGYQYPDIQAPSVLDPNYIWVDGFTGCTKHQEQSLDLSNNPTAAETYNTSLAFIENFWDKIPASPFPHNMVNFYYAYDLYEYASYLYNHDNSTHSKFTLEELSELGKLAATQQMIINGNLGQNSTSNEHGDVTRTIAGRTLAASLVTQMRLNIGSNGNSSKLSVAFGSFEPFLAFFTLSGLADGPSGSDFVDLPNPGAAMVFELFSVGSNASTYPSIEDLWVRFLYRPSPAPDVPFVQYSLFFNEDAESRMLFTDFAAAMDDISVNSISSWCNLCKSITLFCTALGADPYNAGAGAGNGNSGKDQIAPVVAGVIGAIVTAAVLSIGAALVMIVAGVRLYRPQSDRRHRTIAGFKGAEKMPDDADVTYTQNGTRHERQGSWELRDDQKPSAKDGPTPPESDSMPGAGGASVVGTKDLRSSSFKDIEDDDSSIMGHTAVHPRENL
ncbi:hypothetical protein VTK73DRAFT_6390 [Phialemonium thermophilum]|uniref:Uncharacterized protein n=1 Tax=Phialemonium thermophilum TaxID=223376 RepID=A0ABR3XVF5_9PEZI